MSSGGAEYLEKHGDARGIEMWIYYESHSEWLSGSIRG